MIKIDLQTLKSFEQYYKPKPYKQVLDFLCNLYVQNDGNKTTDNDYKVVFLVTGGIAAGKSTLAYNLINYFNLKLPFVGTDIIYNSQFGNGNNFDYEYEKARECTDSLLESYISTKQSFIWETVISKQKKLDFLTRCCKEGYSIMSFFIGTQNHNVSMERCKQRQGEGGNDVSEFFLQDRYIKTIESLYSLYLLSEVFAGFDSTNDFQLVYYKGRDCHYKAPELPNWAIRGLHEDK